MLLEILRLEVNKFMRKHEWSETLPRDFFEQRCGDEAIRHLAHPFDDPRFARWLELHVRTRQSPRERAETACVAATFAVRMRKQIGLAHVRSTMSVARLTARDADMFGTVRQVAHAAAAARCAPWLDNMAVAAGTGREVWDEPCERWVELPPGVPRARYVALNVAGDSMTPVLVPGDVLLVHVGSQARPGALVVARHPDEGYVVKYVGDITAQHIRLESFHPGYTPFTIANDSRSVVGIVSHILRYDASAERPS